MGARDANARDSMKDPATVLVVDNDENLSYIIAASLTTAGYDVQTAATGLDGLSVYLEQQPDVVLTDIEMPELDGLEMMRCIRAVNSRVKTIYISGAVRQYRDVLTRESEQYGAVVLNKPFSRSELIATLNGWRSGPGMCSVAAG